MKNKYGELRSGWALVLSLLMMFVPQFILGIAIVAIAMVVMGAGTIANDTDAYMRFVTDLTSTPLTNYIMYSVMIGGLLLLFWLLYKRPIRQMGLFRDGWIPQTLFGGLMGIVLMALAVIVLVVFGTAKLSDFNLSGFTKPLFWAGLLTYIFVGFFEELLSRGFMMTALKTTRNRWVIIFLPSVIFGLLHFMNANVTFFSLVNIALVGVLFSYLFIKTGRLWAPIGFHITWNFFQGYIFGVPVSGTAVPDSALIKTLFTGPEWLTGGAFGVEGGAACTLVIILGLAFTYFCVKKPEAIDRLWRIDSDMPLTRGVKKAEESVSE